MKLRYALMSVLLAGTALFAGCNSNKFDIKSEKPKEIANFDGNVKDVTPKSGDLIATIEIEGYGTMKAVLFPEAAPVGVENFQKLCDAGYYDGLKIHRVMKGFMMQGGSANGDGTGGEALVNGGKFSIETAQNARHFYGALSYANAGVDNNTTQFFIINNKTPVTLDTSNLDAAQQQINSDLEYLKEYEKEFAPAVLDMHLNEVKSSQYTLDFTKYATDEIKARYAEKGGYPWLDGGYTVFGQVYEGFDVIDAIADAEVVTNAGGEKSEPKEDIIIKTITVSTFE